LAGSLLAGLVILLGSLAIVGPSGLRASLATVRSMSGFRDVMPIVIPKIMINWRGLMATFLPEETSEATGQTITLILSIATAAALIIVWRGEWNPCGDRFPTQVLATAIVMMMASYHNHIHSAALLLVPGMAVFAKVQSPRHLRSILLLGLFVPVPLFFATGSTLRVAWLFIALMLAALAIIVATELSWIGTAGGRGLGSDLSEPAGAR
jgi:hypothetical protein